MKPNRRHNTRGLIRDTALLALAGGGSIYGLFANVTPPDASADILTALLGLGPNGLLAIMLWQSKQAETVSAKAAGEARDALNELRVEEAKTFGQELLAIRAEQNRQMERLLTAVIPERDKAKK